jgi:cell division protein FtsN
MQKAGLILVGLIAVGCIQNTYNISPQFHSSGTVNIDGRVDADDPRVTVTVDDVTVDWKELKELIEKKMANMPKETKEKVLLSAASAPAPAPSPAPSGDVSAVETPTRMTHSVQVGAHRQKEKAEEQATRLVAKGYSARVLKLEDSQKRSWYTVRIGDYPSGESAQATADEFSRREKTPGTVRPFGSL